MIELLKTFAAAKLNPSEIGVERLSAGDIVASVLYIVYFVAGVGAVLAIIVSGYVFMSGSYDPAKIVQAKNAILYSVVGLVFVIIAFAITSFVIKVM